MAISHPIVFKEVMILKIGYVTGSSEASPYEFYVRLKSGINEPPDFMVRIGDIVRVDFEYPNFGGISIYGMVTKILNTWDVPMRGFEEIITIEKGIKPKLSSFIAKIVTTRIVSGRGDMNPPDVPPIPGGIVHLVKDNEVNVALGFDTFSDRKLPVGLLENDSVAFLDLSYILGENGAHINISGQSGVASKTSYTTFLMRSIMDNIKKSRRYGHLKPIFVVFNVKGDSLMFIDHYSRRWMESEDTDKGREWRRMYERLGISPKPFENAEFYAVGKSEFIGSGVDSLRVDAKPYSWNTADFFDLGLFEMIFDPQELERNSNLMLAVISIMEYMNAEDTANPREKAIRRNEISNPYEILIKLKEGESLYNMLKGVGIGVSTIKLLKRRLQLAINIGLARIWKKEGNKIDWNRPGGVTVIDISKLRTRMQSIVVGAVIKEIMKEKESGMLSNSPVFIVLDELNKYAPRDERSEIASIFRDVSERGRSFGVILVGAEQTASEVDYRVITQAATVVVGRQKWVELSKSEYGHLLDEQKRKAATLTQGSVIVDQPFMRVPITVRFPFPAWALNENDYYFEEEGVLI